MEQDSCVGDLAEQLGITQSAVSRQLNLLKSNKLVRRRRDGKMIFYTLVDEHVQIEPRGYELTLRLDEAQKIKMEKIRHFSLAMQLMEPGIPVVPISAAKNEGIEGLIFVR